jgi:hypothetical protein
LGQQGDARLPGGVVGKNDAAIGCRLRDDPCRIEATPRPFEPGFAVRLRALHSLDAPLVEQTLNLSLSGTPSHQPSPSRGSSPTTQTTGAERIC